MKWLTGSTATVFLYGKKKKGNVVRLNCVSVCGRVDFAIVLLSRVMSPLYRVGAHRVVHTHLTDTYSVNINISTWIAELSHHISINNV